MGKNTGRLRSFGAGSGAGVEAGGGVGLDVAALGFSVFSGAGLEELPLGLDAAAEAREGAGSAAGLSLGAALVALVLGSSLGEAVWGFVSLADVALSGLSLAGVVLSGLAGALSSGLAAGVGLSVVGVVLDVFDKSALTVSVFAAPGLAPSVLGASGFAGSVAFPSLWIGFWASAFPAVVALSAAGGV
ncbi:hypothetical protein [Sulfitobacter sp. 1A15299]|uniref:hypothetical protein n=1 Tax=Sulfitobacter sp. 1A15299 TaxID=3368598 RepID=UPI00374774C8